MPTRLIRFLVPGTGGRFKCGGLIVELQTARLLVSLCPTEVVTYRQRQTDVAFLNDYLKSERPDRSILWIVSWGFDVPALIKRLRGHRVAYHAHSSGYGFNLPSGIPVLAVSRNTLGYWGSRAPRNPLSLVPNALDDAWLKRGALKSKAKRPIDVLVQARKSSPYVTNKLVPALRRFGLTVEVQSGWVEDLIDLFNKSTVYLYDSADYWRGRGITEGFGLPPLEALACGCVVFSSLNHALADHGDPCRGMHQIGCGRLGFDVQRISRAAQTPSQWRPQVDQLKTWLTPYTETWLLECWREVLQHLDSFDEAPGALLTSRATWQLVWGQRLMRLCRSGRSVARLASSLVNVEH
ncbi:glycosyltransferase family 1 protein [Synechococcus sp. M16CYN]|uniref:glycosyltransferase family 1 protein n=1 Tax=Synechococcus sp. M16CYN TaxID=3103139 RepID=UPI00324AC522